MRIQEVILVGAMACVSACSRTPEFLTQAQAGQPIVRAIEAYRAQTGTYPTSLTNLVPRFLAKTPDMPDRLNRKFSGWDYCPVTNSLGSSYTLRYYMGKGGVEYTPPNWVGNDEGTRTVILKNE